MMVQDVVDGTPDFAGWGSFDESEVIAQRREDQPISRSPEDIVGNDSAYELDYSVKLQREPIGGIGRTDDLLSTFLDRG